MAAIDYLHRESKQRSHHLIDADHRLRPALGLHGPERMTDELLELDEPCYQPRRFIDRRTAGRELAEALHAIFGVNPLVPYGFSEVNMESDEPILRARDLMERDVITVTPETRLLDVHRLFVEEEIHGAPVVGEDTILRGVVSTLDLLRVVREELEPGAGATVATYFRDQLPYSGPDWLRMPEDFQDRMQDLTAADAMTREIVAVGPDATIEDVARTMLDHRVHRALVLEAGALLGVISPVDLLPALLRVPAAELIRRTGHSR